MVNVNALTISRAQARSITDSVNYEEIYPDEVTYHFRFKSFAVAFVAANATLRFSN